VIGLADLDEARAGCGVVWVLVRVVAFGEGEELAFYFLGASRGGEREGFVVRGDGVEDVGARVEATRGRAVDLLAKLAGC